MGMCWFIIEFTIHPCKFCLTPNFLLNLLSILFCYNSSEAQYNYYAFLFFWMVCICVSDAEKDLDVSFLEIPSLVLYVCCLYVVHYRFQLFSLEFIQVSLQSDLFPVFKYLECITLNVLILAITYCWDSMHKRVEISRHVVSLLLHITYCRWPLASFTLNMSIGCYKNFFTSTTFEWVTTNH